MQKKTITYKDGNVSLNGYYAFDDQAGKKPAVLVVHDWSGQNDFAREKANKFAEMGYVGFAVDMYGEGKTAKSKEEKSGLIQPFIQNREKLKNRILAAFETVKKLENVNPAKIAAIGFCFGGLCVLDLARSGADVKGVVGFHSLLNPADNLTKHAIKAKILALQGFEDPMATPEQIMHFGNEMTEAKADWQVVLYGNAMHAFTNPQVNDPGFGTVYDKQADHRSWIAMQEFLKEVL